MGKVYLVMSSEGYRCHTCGQIRSATLKFKNAHFLQRNSAIRTHVRSFLSIGLILEDDAIVFCATRSHSNRRIESPSSLLLLSSCLCLAGEVGHSRLVASTKKRTTDICRYATQRSGKVRFVFLLLFLFSLLESILSVSCRMIDFVL